MRGLRHSDNREPMRRCVATGAAMPKESLLRFVLAPDGSVVPDLSGTLPGRGIWITPRYDLIKEACRRNLFARSARRSVRVDQDLPGLTARLAHRECLDLLGLARRSGLLVTGFDKVRQWLKTGRAAVLVQAVDAAADGRGKLRRLADSSRRPVPVVELFDIEALGRALGRSNTVHIAIASGGIADRFISACARLEGLMPEGREEARGGAPNEASSKKR